MAASRFKSKAGLYHYGKIRRTDWLPVGEGCLSEQVHRSADSEEEDEYYAEQDAERDDVYESSDGELSADEDWGGCADSSLQHYEDQHYEDAACDRALRF